MKRFFLFSVIMISIIFSSCKKAQKDQLQNQDQASSNGLTLKTLSLDKSITMDQAGDQVISTDDHVYAGGIYYNAAIHGFGYLTYDPVTHHGTVRPIVKTPYGRIGNGLIYDMPHRDTTLTYDDPNVDKLETYLLNNVSIADYSATAHYSGFSIYLPANKGVVDIGDFFVLHQWWMSAPESPAIAFELKPGYYSRLQVAVRYGVKKGSDYHTQYLTRKDTTVTTVNFVDLPRGKWIDFVVRWKFDISGTTGEVKVYRHDKDAANSYLLFDYSGQVGFSGVTSPGIQERFGIYQSDGHTKDHQIFYDEIKSGTTFNDVKAW